MSYTVEMTPTADTELRQSFMYIHGRSPRNAVRWLRGIHKAIDALEDFPNRCGIAPESEHLGERLRHYLFESHRIIFFVDEPGGVVRILRIRHGKMRAIGELERDEE
jgi:plasmid stabilization system protein ParE